MYKELTRALTPELTYLYFTVTSRCNAFCDFCWNWENVADAGKLYKEGQAIKRKELSLEEIEKLTLNLPKMLLVDLYGGEPFVREDLKEIIDLFAINCNTKYFSIPTNAYYTERIEKTLTHALEKYPQSFFRMAISIDGPEKIHNRVRKLKDGYQNAMRTVNMIAGLREKYPNISMSLNSVYNRMTQEAMPAFIEDMMELKLFDSISLGIVRGETYDPTLKEVSVDNYFALKKRIEGYKLLSNQPFSPMQKVMEERTKTIIERAIRGKNSQREFKCYGAKKFTLLDDQGEVFACEHLLEKSLGNIRDHNYNLQAVIDGAKAQQMRKAIKNKECDCIWDCAINTSNVFDPFGYPRLAVKTLGKMVKQIGK
ncbi:MAG: hypothetical protein CME60_03915 [Halobacteriovoraceae bacterium]|nr:hypothetical protein [Halobacteriovoraceae bacterium]